MLRMMRWFGLATAVIVLTGQVTQAQYDSGWGGWGGWGASTPVGDYTRGLGVLAAGAGSYNVQTAQAISMNAQTAMQVDQYLYQSQAQRTMDIAAYNANLRAVRNEARDKIAKRLRENPTPGDVESGDALNVAKTEITNPNLIYVGQIIKLW